MDWGLLQSRYHPSFGIVANAFHIGELCYGFLYRRGAPLAGHPLNMNDLFHGRLNWKCNVIKNRLCQLNHGHLNQKKFRVGLCFDLYLLGFPNPNGIATGKGLIANLHFTFNHDYIHAMV